MSTPIHEIETVLSCYPDGRELHLVIDGIDYDIEIDSTDVEPIIRINTDGSR